MFKVINILFLVFIANVFVFSQQSNGYNENADIMFENALSKFESGKFADARSLFNKCLYEFEAHHRTTAAYIMLAKCEYNLKKYKDALLTINEMMEYYPNSSYIREAYYVSGLANYKMNKIDTALFHLLKAFDNSAAGDAEDRIIRPIKYFYNKKTTNNLPASSNFSNEKTVQLLKAIAREKERGTLNEKAEPEIDSKDESKSESDVSKNVNHETVKDNIPEYRIGVFTVPNNTNSKKGREDLESDFIEALKYAVGEFNNNANVKISLKIVSSKLDSQSLGREIQSLSEDKDLLAIVGPIYSEQFGLAASIASKKGIPIISPTATGNGLASSGDFVFQANPDFITRAHAMAIFGVKRMKLKNIAVFAPKNVYGKMMSESFTREVSKRGGNIIATEFYENDGKMMQKSMLNLVKSVYAKGGEFFIPLAGIDGADNIQKLLKAGTSKKLLDSLKLYNKEVSIYSILGKDAKNKAEKLKLKTFARTDYEVDQPVTSVDAVYIPINSKNDIKNISAALLSYKINAVILGTGDYNHLLELDANLKNMNGLVFDSDSYFDVSNKSSLIFSKSFSEKTGKKVTQYSLFGYDLIGFIAQAVKKGNVTRQAVKNYLTSTDSYQGIHSKISLKSNRINSYLNILEYKNKKISKIDEINVSKE